MTPTRIITIASAAYVAVNVALGFTAIIHADAGRTSTATDYIWLMMLWGPVALALTMRFAYIAWRVGRDEQYRDWWHSELSMMPAKLAFMIACGAVVSFLYRG